ncbi:MAG: SpoIIE family protein phosphatase [Oscillospiraceae bacterium]|nr:SpoIIE family protein phosphatase [Oscillospiraceae bacterium]
MTEKTKKIVAMGKAVPWREIITQKAVWVIAGFALEIGASDFYAAPAASALLAGVSGKRVWYVLAGGILGALLHGFPTALTSIAAMAIVLAARIIPDLNRVPLRAAERFAAAAGACFFSRIAEAEQTTDVFAMIIAGLCAGVFAASIVLLEHYSSKKGLNPTELSIQALFGVISALGFLSLGAMNYSLINVGRIVFGTAFLCIISRKGLVWGAVFGIPAIFGLCAANYEMGVGAAGFAFAALVSGVFIKHGRIARAAGFVFCAAAGTLVSGADEGSLRIIIEAAISGMAYIFLPTGRLRLETGFSDSTATALLCERLNFAADALAGVESGISAAAEALANKYSASSEKIAEKAADRVCRSCPKSMQCWGKHYELFRGEFERLTEQLRTGFPLTDNSMNGECAEICLNQSAVTQAITAEYTRFLSAARDERKISEMRRIYTDRLMSTEQILRDMSRSELGEQPAQFSDHAAEKRAESMLRDAGVKKPRAFVTVGKNRLHFEAYGETEPLVDKEYLGMLLERTLGREVDVPEISGSGRLYRITTNGSSKLSARLGAFQLPKGQNSVCGDCYDSFTDADGILYIILSDGMGTGARARVDSAMACSVTAKLIKSGISLSAALETVNTVMLIKSSDESYATLDICRIDLNSGECAVYKAGAAATYIKSSNKLVRAAISSSPTGTGGKISVPAQRFTVSAGDVIIMITDGAVLDERWLARELSSPAKPEELSERIAKAARSADNGKNDDISVIAVCMGEGTVN